jgi:transcription initiation factor TFIIIB Brf1 subunit/transcription initiation factor TFIIB
LRWINLNEEQTDSKTSKCPHKNVRQERGYLVCQDCGLILEENMPSNKDKYKYIYSEKQRAYERNIRMSDARATQDPKIKQKYNKIKTLEKWFKDYKTSFYEQKKTIDLLKGYGIGLNIDDVKFQEIKERYLRYNRKHKKSYQNMVIIFLAIVWMEIKDTTNIRLEEFIEVCNELGHKINKKMLNNAMLKVLKAEDKWDTQTIGKEELEIKIKKKIKILFQKNLNDIPFENFKEYVNEKEALNKLKIHMLLLLDKILKKMPYTALHNQNYKAFTAGLIYYIAQLLNKDLRQIFTQNLIEKITKFSSTTIRKKYHYLIEIFGNPEGIRENL